MYERDLAGGFLTAFQQEYGGSGEHCGKGICMERLRGSQVRYVEFSVREVLRD